MPALPDAATPALCARCPVQNAVGVASRGPIPARLLFLSGPPRYHEERECLAFASPLFPWWEEMLAECGLDPAQCHYATIVACALPHGRPLRAEELGACARRIEALLADVAPAVVVPCGDEAITAMLGNVVPRRLYGTLVARSEHRFVPLRHPYTAAHYAPYVDEVRAGLAQIAMALAR